MRTAFPGNVLFRCPARRVGSGTTSVERIGFYNQDCRDSARPLLIGMTLPMTNTTPLDRPKNWRAVLDILRPFVALLLVTLAFCLADSYVNGNKAQFASADSFRNVAAQTMVVAAAAIGVTMVIIAGGIDLSVGTAISLCATVIAWGLKEDIALLMVQGTNVSRATRALDDGEKQVQSLTRKASSPGVGSEVPQELERAQGQVASLKTQLEQARAASERWTPLTPWIALPLGVIAGGLCGLFNGVLISKLRLVPFIVTLGTMQLYLGLAKLLADNTTVRPDRVTQVPGWVPNLLSIAPRAQWFGLPAGVWITLLLALVMMALLRYTVFGRYVFAIGSNESTARLCGIGIDVNKIAIYTLSGLFVGIAGLFQFSRLTVGNPTSGLGLELKVIASVVIGGASLSGGRGAVVGTFTGALIMSVITSGCSALGVSNPVQDMILGIIIVAAVAVDQWRQRKMNKG